MVEMINRKLVSAYSKLLKKGVQRITVSLLCEKADVSRANFYNYYKDLNDFIIKLHSHMVDALFEQSILFLLCSEKEIADCVKKENLLLNDSETEILKNMLHGSNYIDFAVLADRYYTDEKKRALFSRKIWEEKKDILDIFTRGYLPVIIINFLNYNEESFEADIRNSRALFKYFFGEAFR